MIVTAYPSSVTRAAQLIRSGSLVAFPTETVYGLGCDATSSEAVIRLYEAKGRPSYNPLIMHVAELSALENIVVMSDDAARLAASFWPGPLTMVLPRHAECNVSPLATANLPTIAVRIPKNDLALELLQSVGRPVAAPSANRSGRLSPTSAAHVAKSLGEDVAMILDGGATPIGLESTIIDMSVPHPLILRAGAITPDQIQDILGYRIGVVTDSMDAAPTAPGMLRSHYAPERPLRLNATDPAEDEALLAYGDDSKVAGGGMRLNLSPHSRLTEAAANLFAMLHMLDTPVWRGIAVMPIPEQGIGLAINDRLRRAAAPKE